MFHLLGEKMCLVTSLSIFLYGCLTQSSFKQTCWKLEGKWWHIFLILAQALYILSLMSGIFTFSHLEKGFAHLFQMRSTSVIRKKEVLSPDRCNLGTKTLMKSIKTNIKKTIITLLRKTSRYLHGQ